MLNTPQYIHVKIVVYIHANARLCELYFVEICLTVVNAAIQILGYSINVILYVCLYAIVYIAHDKFPCP